MCCMKIVHQGSFNNYKNWQRRVGGRLNVYISLSFFDHEIFAQSLESIFVVDFFCQPLFKHFQKVLHFLFLYRFHIILTIHFLLNLLNLFSPFQPTLPNHTFSPKYFLYSPKFFQFFAILPILFSLFSFIVLYSHDLGTNSLRSC